MIEPTTGVRRASFKRLGSTWKVHDLGGRLEGRALWPGYLATADGIIWVIDATDTERLEEVRAWFMQVQHHPTVASRGTPILVLLNQRSRRDAGDTLTEGLTEKLLGLNSVTGRSPVHILAVNALEGSTVDVGLHWLQSKIA